VARDLLFASPVHHKSIVGWASARNVQRGFTLLETLVTVGIAGTLAAVTFPSLSNALNSHRLTAGLRGAVGCIRVARSTAVTRNEQAQVVVSADGTTLTVQGSSDGVTWTNIGTPLVLDGGVTVSSVSPTSGLLFTSQGTVASTVTVSLANVRGDVRTITVGVLGRVDMS